MDFTRGQDRLQLDRSTFWAFAYEGLVLDKHVVNGRSATNADHRLVYDATTGAVSYDADGVGSVGQVQFATLVNKPSALRASDFGLIWA
ncbi:MAG TPA: hypothetical protein VIL09_06585 [Microvirga sp.]|jgi:Ca2+-binding RTX toxin-like protein